MGDASANRVTRLLRSVWGVCFGFGLSPVRATATVVVLLAIGTGGVWWAWKQADALVINYSYAMTEVADAPVFLRPKEPRPRQARRPAATATSSRCFTPWT